jgi:hypothetical protein
LRNNFKIIKRVLLLIGIIGTSLTLIIPIIGITLENNIYKYYRYFILAIPFVIPAWTYGVFKSSRISISKYGIRFWGAIKNAPKWMNLALVVFLPIIFITSAIKPEIGLLGVFPLFDYMALLICLSAFLESDLS